MVLTSFYGVAIDGYLTSVGRPEWVAGRIPRFREWLWIQTTPEYAAWAFTGFDPAQRPAFIPFGCTH